MAGDSNSKQAAERDRLERQRKRSIAIALALGALVIMFYVATWVNFSNLPGPR